LRINKFYCAVVLAALVLAPVRQRPALSAEPAGWQPSPGHTQIPIWPGVAPDVQSVPGPEVSTYFNTGLYAPVDAADQESSRPDFAIAIYPGHLALAENSIALNPNIKSHITAQTPPTFLLQNEDDHVDRIEDVLSYYMGLKAANVPVELHAYAQGGHAFGLRPSKLPVSGWPLLVEKWLGTIGMISQ
jgi:acetyl esterase/lipase